VAKLIHTWPAAGDWGYVRFSVNSGKVNEYASVYMLWKEVSSSFSENAIEIYPIQCKDKDEG